MFLIKRYYILALLATWFITQVVIRAGLHPCMLHIYIRLKKAVKRPPDKIYYLKGHTLKNNMKENIKNWKIGKYFRMTARTSKKAIKAKAKASQDRNVHEVLKNQNSWCSAQHTLKVSKSQKQIVVSSILPKNEQNLRSWATSLPRIE